jgi:hypothetical protein
VLLARCNQLLDHDEILQQVKLQLEQRVGLATPSQRDAQVVFKHHASLVR